MLRSFDPEGERDIVFVPVGVNYDRVLEDRSLLLDLDEGAKRPAVLRSAVNSAGFALRNFAQMTVGRWHRFGYACVNIGAPISMRDFCRERGLRPAELSREDRFAAVGEVADELMASLSKVIPVVPVSVVATVFQTASKALTELELKAAAQNLMADLESRGVRIYIPRQDREYSIDVGLRMLTLRHIVEEENGLYSVVPEERTILAYYANSIAQYCPGTISSTSES